MLNRRGMFGALFGAAVAVKAPALLRKPKPTLELEIADDLYPKWDKNFAAEYEKRINPPIFVARDRMIRSFELNDMLRPGAICYVETT